MELPPCGACLVPPQLLLNQGVLFVGVLGKKEDTQLYPTIWTSGILVMEGVPVEGKTPLPPLQYEIIPSPEAIRDGEIFQYTGVSQGGYVTGFFYRCEVVADGYDWAEINTQSGGSYLHPDTHPAGMIVEDETRRFVKDTEKKQWNEAYGHSIVKAGNPHGVTTVEISAVATEDKISNQDIYDILNNN